MLTKFLKTVAEAVDEFTCRVQTRNMDALTNLGKSILPEGLWGHGPTHASTEPTVYLTFDDGPHPATTPRLLALLSEHGIHATFFLIGNNCHKFPQLVERIHEQEHAIGNHTFYHSPLLVLPARRIEREIAATNEIIEKITGSRPKFFRPPFGLMDERAARLIKDHGMTPVYWGSVPEWMIPGTHRVIRRAMWKVADGTIIVLHEGGHVAEQSIAAAGQIICRITVLGYQFSKVKGGASFQAVAQ
jgi:peptidoglycan-N-acetylglucosamine deacetylase